MQKVSLTHSLLVAVAVALIVAGAAMAQAPITMNAGAAQVEWQATVPGSLLLNVSGPEGFHLQERFAPGEAAVFSVFDATGNLRPAGSYTFEAVLEPLVDDAARAELDAIRANGGDGALGALQKAGRIPTEPTVYSGYFAIVGGAIASGGEEEPGAGPAAGGNQISAKDQVINDDLIVTGSICVGFDCVNGESFGFDTLRLKENNLRIKFQDTSNSASFPSNDWQITANDSSNGGANKFSIDDIDGGRTPFTIEASAPSNSLYVDDGGRIGLGTATPVVQLHQVDGNTPTLRLQQDGSSGFTPQTWDVAGNETNFFVRDATNGSTLPLRIRPSAPSNSIYIDTDGDVGFGTASPDANLHVFTNSAITTDGQLHIENTNGTAADRNMVRIENNGPPTMFFSNTNTTSGNWTFTVNNSSQFQLNNATAAGVQMTLSSTGNMTISGALTENSSRTVKTGFQELDPRQVLDQLVGMPVTTWAYSHDESGTRHIGPMAEDFYAAYGLGEDNKHIAISDKAGVALAAIKGLNEVVKEKEAEIAQLEKQTTELLEDKDRQIDELTLRLEALERAIEQH